MLKLNYTEFGLYMERATVSLDVAIAQRIVLALRLGQSLHVEPSQAAFLLPAQANGLTPLKALLKEAKSDIATVIPVDDEFVEISLSGSWVAISEAAHEGTFLTAISDFPSANLREQVEALIYKLWQMSEAPVSSWA
ncbi:MAG: alr0857 family protein [Leptolyngbyaceae cyanobacterium]